MKKSGITRTCPECGRRLETCINRWKVEMWPAHKAAAYADRTMDYEANIDRPAGWRDNEVQCLNSAQTVD